MLLLLMENTMFVKSCFKIISVIIFLHILPCTIYMYHMSSNGEYNRDNFLYEEV